MESPSDNESCFDESSEDGGDVQEDGLEFCEHCGEIVHRSTHWRHKQLRLTSDPDEEDDNRLFGIAMHNDIELSDTPHDVDTDHDFSHLYTHQDDPNPSISEVAIAITIRLSRSLTNRHNFYVL